MKISVLITALAVIMPGCFQQQAGLGDPMPEMIWPAPPEVPRIMLVNSFSRPEDLNLQESFLKQFFSFAEKKDRSLVKPYGIETDSAGRYFVVDTFGKNVHVFDLENSEYYIFPEGEITFESPIDIAIGDDGMIFVTDSKEAVVKLFRDNGETYAGTIGEGLLGRPTGIAINKSTNELLVVDTMNSQVVSYGLDSHEFKGFIGGDGEQQGMFHYPTNIFVSDGGNIFVSDSLNFRIQIFSPQGEFMKEFGKPGNSPGYFSRPRGVAVDSDGNIYVVDALFDNVQVFNRDGMLLMDFGGPGYGYGEFWLPSGIFIDSRDRIFVADTYNKRVQVFQYLKGGDF